MVFSVLPLADSLAFACFGFCVLWLLGGAALQRCDLRKFVSGFSR
jgi:hypothetical protein